MRYQCHKRGLDVTNGWIVISVRVKKKSQSTVVQMSHGHDKWIFRGLKFSQLFQDANMGDRPFTTLYTWMCKHPHCERKPDVCGLQFRHYGSPITLLWETVKGTRIETKLTIRLFFLFRLLVLFTESASLWITDQPSEINDASPSPFRILNCCRESSIMTIVSGHYYKVTTSFTCVGLGNFWGQSQRRLLSFCWIYKHRKVQSSE